jgi:hypothetical protein
MAKDRDGVYTRPDREGYWISWQDAQGRRRWRKTEAKTLTLARQAVSNERVKAEQARVLGFAPPGDETFGEVASASSLPPKSPAQRTRLRAHPRNS